MINNPKPKIQNLPLVVITGPTASGKTSLAIELAREMGGEIICADSRTIYTGMDIGTAKPTATEQALVPHWAIDIVRPDESFNASDFQTYANQKIIEIRSRGNIPFLVGGTGLYIDSVVFQFKFGNAPNTELRTKLQHMTIDELHAYCNKHNIEIPENSRNKRYVIRAIENDGNETTRQVTPIENTIIVGIATDRSILRSRIETRIEQLFDDGVVDEAKQLGDMYGWDGQAMTSNTYQVVREYLQHTMTLDQAKVKNVTLDYRLAKRQMTWLRRNQFIHWEPLEHAADYVRSQLANRT